MDMHFERIAFGTLFPAVKLLLQPAPCGDLVRMAHQVVQNLEFTARQGHCLGTNLELA